jgi:hypothetical protein
MATVRVVHLLQRAQIILQDTTATRWPLPELQHWLNDAYREITLARPDVSIATAAYVCKSGSRQDLNHSTSNIVNALMLKDVIRTATDNAFTANVKAVRAVDRRILDDQRPGWHLESASAATQYFMYDPRNPKEFFIYPQSSGSGHYLEVTYSKVPEGHELTEAQLGDTINNTTVIKIDDSYANAILDYILYRAYSKDVEYAANGQRALNHYNAMKDSLGIKTGADLATAPVTPMRASVLGPAAQ